jgi:hypothetical protein
VIGNLLRPPPEAKLTATQKRKLRELRRDQQLETGVYEAAGIRTRASRFTRPDIMTAIDAAAREHRPPRVRHDEQIRHRRMPPLYDEETAREHRREQELPHA